MKRYFHRKGRWKLGFVDRLDKRKPSLVKLSELKIQRHLKVDWKYRVYDGDPETIEYWQRREYFKGRNSLTLGSVQEKLFLKQKGLCALCFTPLENQEKGSESYQTHHLKPQQFGGTHQLRNLRLVHTECHRTIHRLFTPEQMARYAESGIDYLRLLKGKRTAEEGESVAR